MPVHVANRNGKFRVVEPDGSIATTQNGFARDGGGHPTRDKALRQMRAINSNLSKSSKKTLYINRPLLNTSEFLEHFKRQGFVQLTKPENLHVTVAFSWKPVEWALISPDSTNLRINGYPSARIVQPLGPEGAIVQRFFSNRLWDRWFDLCNSGASWDYDDYTPHVTLTYNGGDLDVSMISPYLGELYFGPEEMEEINIDWRDEVD
jgi:hypothetical protein